MDVLCWQSVGPLSPAEISPSRMLQFYWFMAAIVQRQNAGLWHRMSWVRTPLAAPKQHPTLR